jgi:hypothetical protein
MLDHERGSTLFIHRKTTVSVIEKYNFLVFGFALNKLTQNLGCLPFISTSYSATLETIIVYYKKLTVPETHYSTTNKG